MVSKFRGMLVAIAAGAMTMMAVESMAQAPAGGPPGGGMRGMGMGMGMGMDKAGMWQRLALDAEDLNLSAEQKGRIDKILDGFIAEQGKMRAGMQPGTPPSQEMMGAMRARREKLNTDIGAVMNDGQKKTWMAAMAARPPMGPGGPGGPPRQ